MIRKLISDVSTVYRLNRQSSDRLTQIAQRALRSPERVSIAEIKSLAASVLSQSNG